ncbi:MAG: hypothetical protein C0498_13570 [Anaerolinea sp.]|jgi:uncharacterized membrane protein YphA (DoxX/SURF4 family)|nr:hypothetical protein [Anaerolinea sp.]
MTLREGVVGAWPEFLAVTVRVAVGGALLFAGVAKLRGGRERFLQVVLGYELITGVWAGLIGRFLPLAETVVGFGVLIGFITPINAVLAFGLFLAFALAVTHSLYRGLFNDCGCFGSRTPVQWRLVYRNIILMGLSIVLLGAGSDAASTDALLCGSANCLRSASPAVMGTLLLMWLATFSGVALLRWRWPAMMRAKQAE